jgi:hypothetical protein
MLLGRVVAVTIFIILHQQWGWRQLLLPKRYVHMYLLLPWRNSPTRASAVCLLRFLDYTQWHVKVGRTPLEGWSAQSRDLYLTTNNTYERQIFLHPGGIQIGNHSKRSVVDPRLRHTHLLCGIMSIDFQSKFSVDYNSVRPLSNSSTFSFFLRCHPLGVLGHCRKNLQSRVLLCFVSRINAKRPIDSLSFMFNPFRWNERTFNF